MTVIEVIPPINPIIEVIPINPVIEVIPPQESVVAISPNINISYTVNGSEVYVHPFSFGDANNTILTLTTNQVLLKIIIEIVTPFNGDGTMVIGTNEQSDLFLNTNQIDPQSSGVYEVSPLFKSNGETSIFLTINTSGETEGNGIIYLFMR
jgi:hypothetical protein